MSSKHAGLVLLLMVSLCGSASAVTRHRHTRARGVRRHLRAVRHIHWNPLFPGSHEMLVRQNEELDFLELPRIEDDEELLAREDAGELVEVEDSRSLLVAGNLVQSRRYCKPWTRDFLQDLGEDYFREFHRPLMITSLVRTAEQQHKLRRVNCNAAPEEGDTASTHLTGVTADILKRGMTRQQHRWLNQHLLPLKQAGLIDPIEERRQPVFHIVVFDDYTDWRDAQTQPKAAGGD